MDHELSRLSHAELIDRCKKLEQQVQTQTTHISELSKASQRRSSTSPRPDSRKKPAKKFDASRHTTRFIALKFSYLGHQYNGFEHANRCFTPLPTIEEVLWKALRKARLISPPIEEGADDSFEVVFDPKARERKYFIYGKTKPEHEEGKVRLDLNWDGCQYSKCGRTDRGVSAFGQVIGIRVRSNAPVLKNDVNDITEAVQPEDSVEKDDTGVSESTRDCPEFDPIKDELPYIYILNALLPPDIRILAWCASPPEGFDARFSCLERHYKYFFTNPAFCPTPGPMGLMRDQSAAAPIREGWLDIEKMREGAKKLIGLNDYRNFCQIDASKQMPSCERRINFADIEEVDSSPVEFVTNPDLNADGRTTAANAANGRLSTSGPKVYALVIHGSAFLWHQIRCIAAILFLVGQGHENSDVVDKLLDIKATTGRPDYTMADDAPLVLWDCVFPGDEDVQEGGLNWIYAGDEAAVSSMNSRCDGRFGPGGLADELFVQWRDIKIKEAQIGGLLNLVMSSGDKTSIQRGGFRNPSAVTARSSKIFGGAGRTKLAGQYIPLMSRQRMEPLEVLNAKFLATTKGARRFPSKLTSDLDNLQINSA